METLFSSVSSSRASAGLDSEACDRPVASRRREKASASQAACPEGHERAGRAEVPEGIDGPRRMVKSAEEIFAPALVGFRHHAHELPAGMERKGPRRTQQL